MKPTFIALLALCLCLPLMGVEKKKTDVESDGYKGRVKSVKHSKFKIEEKFGEFVRTEDGVNSTYKYDAKGNMVEEMKYNSKTAFGKTRYVPTKEYTWEFTCWD